MNSPQSERVKLAQVIQQTTVRWDEKGTEARSITHVFGASFGASVTVDLPIIFYANHPFVYVIYHQRTHQLFFMGSLAMRGQLVTSEE